MIPKSDNRLVWQRQLQSTAESISEALSDLQNPTRHDDRYSVELIHNFYVALTSWKFMKPMPDSKVANAKSTMTSPHNTTTALDLWKEISESDTLNQYIKKHVVYPGQADDGGSCDNLPGTSRIGPDLTSE